MRHFLFASVVYGLRLISWKFIYNNVTYSTHFSYLSVGSESGVSRQNETVDHAHLWGGDKETIRDGVHGIGKKKGEKFDLDCSHGGEHAQGIIIISKTRFFKD